MQSCLKLTRYGQERKKSKNNAKALLLFYCSNNLFLNSYTKLSGTITQSLQSIEKNVYSIAVYHKKLHITDSSRTL